LLLVLIPWSAFWDRNYFVEWSEAVRALLTSNYTRGAITGLGLLNLWAALGELGELFGTRQSDNPPSDINLKSDLSDLK
jgi:hypothetical protein